MANSVTMNTMSCARQKWKQITIGARYLSHPSHAMSCSKLMAESAEMALPRLSATMMPIVSMRSVTWSRPRPRFLMASSAASGMRTEVVARSSRIARMTGSMARSGGRQPREAPSEVSSRSKKTGVFSC